MEKKRDEEWTILEHWYKDDQYREVQWVNCLDYLDQIDIIQSDGRPTKQV